MAGSKMMCMPHSPVHLVIGDDEFLAERARIAIRRAAGEESGTVPELRSLRAGEVTQGEILEVTSPSLFGDNRVIVITEAERIGAEVTKIIVDAARNPAPGMTIVVDYRVTAKTMKAKKKPPELVDKLRKLGHVHEVYSLYPNELGPWVTREFASHGVRPTPDVVQALLQGVGSDLRELASAVSQLVADTAGEVTRQAVQTYYVGVAEVANWDIADAAVAGKTEAAVSTCRRALQLGAKPAAISAALASKVGAIARLYTAHGNPNQLARQVGMALYAVKLAQPVARRWSGESITRAVIIVDELDLAVKSYDSKSHAFEVEAAVRKIAELAG